MEYCKNCIFYDKAYDDLRRSGNDIIFLDGRNKDLHYCRQYPDGIPPKIWASMQKCSYKGEI